jgi:DNA (cytosine-5)-methyltransferase 1
LRHLDLFTGIGGFAYAARQVWGKDYEPVAFCEIDKFCQKVLKKHWPDVEIIDDIKDEKVRQFRDIDLLTGGFPCQPHSLIGKRKGVKDERWLWPQMQRIIDYTRPNWVLIENVPGILSTAIDTVHSDLERMGYIFWSFCISACTIGAEHKRERLWIIANSNSSRLPLRSETAKNKENEIDFKKRIGFAKFSKITLSRYNWKNKPVMGRGVYGIPNRVDRLKTLGNAIVPQVAMVIMAAIKEIDNL